MSETTMPAAEAAVDTSDERVSYELAFHVLPTVAEGEVKTIEDAITGIITEAGGTVGLAEAAQRFELAYELQKMVDGKYRRFATAYFGWVRFTAEPTAVAEILAEVEAHESVLRALIVRLTRQEEEHPFYLHESLAADKQVTDIDVTAAIAAEADSDTSEDDETSEQSAENDSEDTGEEATDDATMEASDEPAATESDDDNEKPAA